MRQRDALEMKREQARLSRELQEIKRLNAKQPSTTKQSKRSRPKRQRKVGPPTNMVFLNRDALVSDDAPIASLFEPRLQYRESSRDTAHKRRRNRNSEAIASSIRTPRQRTRNDYQYGTSTGERSTRPA